MLTGTLTLITTPKPVPVLVPILLLTRMRLTPNLTPHQMLVRMRMLTLVLMLNE